MKKLCVRCQKEKDVKHFNIRGQLATGAPKYASYCRPCNALNLKEHYRNNPQYYKNKRQRLAKKHREWFLKYKDGVKCIKCRESHPACLDFHHTDASKKEFNISHAVHNLKSIKKIEEEIRKCVVLCSNCHKKLHWKQAQNLYPIRSSSIGRAPEFGSGG